MTASGEAKMATIVLENWDKLTKWFDLVRSWTKQDIRGRLIAIDEDNRQRKRFDLVRVAILTSSLDSIKSVIWVKVDEDIFPISVAEEIIVTEDRKEFMRYQSDRLSYTTSSPSISLSAMLDSVGSDIADDHLPVVATPSVVAGDNSKSIPVTDIMVVAAHRVTRSNDEIMLDEFENLESSRGTQCKKFGGKIFINKKLEAFGKATITGGRSMRILKPIHIGPERVNHGATSSKAQNQGYSKTTKVNGLGNNVEHLEASTDT
ncbi:hypothetical protein Ancab_017231 [Ancistrocladus abbreviatus]